MQRIFTCVFVLMIMLASIIVFGNYDGGYLRDITMNYKTASLDWGSNKKNLNVLFIVPRQGGREVVELVQRLPMNYEAVTASNSVILAEDGNIYEAAVAGTSGYEKKLELFKKLEKKYDLFVIGNFEFRRLPEEAQFKILSQVAHGAGLIIIYPGVLELKKVFSTPVEGAEEILSLAPLKGLPAEVQKVPDKDLLKTYQFKEGRILVLDYKAYRGAYVGMALTAPNEFSNRWQAEYENSMVLLIRSMLWAAGEKLVSVTLPGFVEEQPQSGGSIKFNCTQPKGDYELHTRIRDEFNQVMKEYNNELSDTLSVDLPFLPGGKYYLDFILKNKNGEVLNLGSRSFKVESPVGRLSLSTNDKESFEKNEKIKVILRIQKPLATVMTIAVSLVDSPYGRVWYEKRIKLNEGEEKTEFEIDKFYMPTIAGYLKCSILNGNDEIAKCEKTLFFPDRGLEIYPTLSFNGVPGEYLGLFYAKQVVDRMGWRIGLKMPDPDGGNARTAALLNQRFAPYTTLIGVEEDKNKKGWTKQYDWFCLPPGECKKANKVEDQSFYNPEIKNLFRKGIEYRIRNIVKYGPPVYSLGDENHFDINAGFTPSDNVEFKRFLKARYGTIESLNKEWDSNYKSFDDTEHYTLQQAQEKKIFPAWFDHRLFVEKQYADIHHFLAEEIKKYDPRALVGAEGSAPGNLEETIKDLEFWGPYSDPVMDEVLRSIGNDKIRTMWWGGYVSSHGGRNEYPLPLWKGLLTGNVNGNAFYSASVAAEGVLGSDMDFAAYMKKLIPFLDELRYGLAQLLINTPLKQDGVAVMWSHASDNAYLLDSRIISPRDSVCVFMKYCYQIGLNFDFITESMMKKGSLKNYKALFLFGASSISNQERDAILDFVSNGGIVISDLNPGILNGYLRPTSRNQLEELFGKITYDGIKKTIMDKLDLKRKFRNESLTLTADKAVMLPGIAPFQVTDYGKGSAILLNFSLTAIGNTCSAAAPLDRFLSNLLAAAGIIQPVRVKDVAPGDTIIRVRQGQNLNLIGILADKNNIGKTVEVIIPQNAYIYEPAKGFIQHGNSIKLKLDTPFKLISCFIAKQEKPEIVISSDKAELGKPIMLSLRKITPGTVLLLEIIAPNGNPMPLRKQVVTVNAQSVAEFPVWFAYNDQPGSYTLILTDVATGLKNDQKIELYDAHKIRGFITNSNS